MPFLDFNALVRLYSQFLAQSIQLVTIGYIENLLDIIYNYVLPLLNDLYYQPEDLFSGFSFL